jgi:hypothetical protein
MDYGTLKNYFPRPKRWETMKLFEKIQVSKSIRMIWSYDLENYRFNACEIRTQKFTCILHADFCVYVIL